MTLRRIKKELEEAENYPQEGVLLITERDDPLQLQAYISGPQGTVYEGGLFKLNVALPKDYPFKPAKITFSSQIYHPNANSSGTIFCYMNYINSNHWSPAVLIQRILIEIRSILIQPDIQSLVSGLESEYLKNRAQFEEKARDYVNKYA